MKVLSYSNDNCFIILNTFSSVTPFSRQFDCCLVRFCSAVHKQRFVITKKLTYIFFSNTKLIVIKSAGCKRKLLRLFDQCLNYSWMTMTLINGAVSRQKIVITFPFNIPEEHAFSFAEHNR